MKIRLKVNAGTAVKPGVWADMGVLPNPCLGDGYFFFILQICKHFVLTVRVVKPQSNRR